MEKYYEIEERVKRPKLTKEERRKLRTIKKLINGEINGPKAAKLLKISTRQVRNLKRQVYNEGDLGIIHKNRFNKPSNTYDLQIRKELAHIYRTEYKGVNFSKFAEEMQKRGYQQSRSTIYNILRQQRIRSPQRKRKKKNTRKQAVDVKKSK